MNWQRLKTQLAGEARDYLADFRDLRDSLRFAEGWLALGLLLISVVIVGAFFFLAIGFTPSPNSAVTSFIYSVGLRPCRDISNTTGVILFINLFVLLFLVTAVLGSVLSMMDRVKRGEPREPRELISTAALMIAVGIGGITYMAWIC